MAVHKITPNYLNRDDDERLVKSVEMTDAVNIRVSSDADGDAFVVKNAYGNTAVDLATSLPAGTNKVLGSVSDEQLGFIFYFVWNSNNEHSIYRYSTGSNTSVRIMKDSVLSFTENGFVKGNIFVNINGDVLLYFSDGSTAPKKINTTKALINAYPQLLTGTDEEKLAVLTVAKAPPLDPPTYKYVHNQDIKDNRLKESNFQFAYKYIYRDGEHSALSPYSTLTVAAPQLKDAFSNAGQLNFFNELEVYVKNSPLDAEKIVLYAREGNEGAFYEVDEVNNTVGTAPKTIKFRNDVLGVALPQNEQSKLYDNVPQFADSQEIINGRLMYGGYTEGYPNIDVDGELIANYHNTEPFYNVTATYDTNGQLEFDWSKVPSFIQDASTLYVNMHYSARKIHIETQGSNDLNIPSGYFVSHIKKDGSDTRTIQMQRLTNGYDAAVDGVQIKKVLAVPANSTRADIIALFKSATQGNQVQMLLSPLPGSRSVTGVTTAWSTIWTDESADFRGRAFVELDWNSSNTLNLEFRKIELYVNSFYVGGDQREVVSYDTIILDFNAASYGVQWDQEGLSIGSFFVAESVFGSRSFKSGSSHKLGVVYYDEVNRSGGVQELGAAYVQTLSRRADENGLYGRSSVVMRMNHTAPDWAKRWSPVYIGKGNTELKLMYGVQGAYIPFRFDQGLSSISSSEVIYLSLSQLFDSEGGYVKGSGANIEYAYEKGDKLRIVQYNNGQRESQEFEVVDFVKLAQDDSNPILIEISEGSISNTTGSFLVVKENEDAVDFKRSRISKNTSGWFEGCIVEVVRERKQSNSDIYYEIGKSYEVSNGVHSDDRSSTTSTLAFSVTTPSALEFSSTAKIFKGDVLSDGVTSVTVGNVYEEDGLYIGFGTSLATPSNGVYTVTNPEAVVQLEQGDVYWRLRSLYVETEQPDDNQYQQWNRNNAVVDYIEDYSVSDFFSSKSISIGRPIAYIPDAKTVKRKGSITYSDYDSEDSTRLNLSSFNLSLANYKDLAYEHGSIKYLVGYNEALYFLQEKRCGVAGVGRDIVQTGSGDNLVSLSRNVIGSERYYVGEYGVGNHPESVAFKDGMIYFSDVNANKVLRIDSQGITVISDVGMESYFENKFGEISKYKSHLVGGGIDDDNDHYVVHSGDITTSQVRINTDQYSYDVSLDSTGTQVSAPVQYDPTAVFGFLNDPRTFDETCDFFDNGAEAVVYLDQLSSGAPVYTSFPYQASNILGVATNSNLDFFVMIRLNMFTPSFFFDNNFCDTDANGIIDPNSATVDSFTVAYGTASRKWETRYSFVPERIDSLHSNMYSFSGGKIYKHDENASRNTFYGAPTAESLVEVISNPQPSAIKTFESLSIEGNSSWDAVVTTSKQTSSIDNTSFKEKEGFYYSYIHGATSSYGSSITSVTSTSEIFSLGEVSSVSGSTVTFKNALSTSFPIGSTATLYKVGISDLNSLSVNPVSIDAYNEITFSGSVTAVSGDLLIIVGNSAVEGDQIRDYYAKIKLTKTSSTPIELFAINTIVADSKAHN